MKTWKKILAMLMAVVLMVPMLSGIGAMKASAAGTSDNIALNKPTMATAGNSARAVDGDTTNYWDGGVAPSELIVDLEGYYALDKVVVIPYYGGSRYYHYEVYGSADGYTYDLLGEKSDNTAQTSAGNTFALAGEDVYRYVKVRMTYNSANPSVHINELMVYGTKVEDYDVSEVPETDPNDAENIAFGKPTRSQTNDSWTMLAVDGNTSTTWSGEDYPKFVDVDLMANYDIDTIKVHLPVLTDGKGEAVTFSYTVYGSLDGSNFSTIVESEQKAPTEEGDTYTFEEPLNYRVIRVNMTSNSKGEGANSLISEIKVYGEKNDTKVTETRTDIEISSYETWLQNNYGVDVASIKDENGNYSMEDTYTQADTFEAIEGLITRILGSKYIDWFKFEIEESENGKDYYEISNVEGKILIKGNEGLSITTGLNHYLKYYCNVHVSQQTSQVTMPESVVPVDRTIFKESPYEIRYAYNYCTLSYTMPFWGYDEWQRELDYFALNGVNLILDTTATEALWVKYLMNFGYSVDDAKDFVCGYSYKAWWLMGNLEGYGGNVGDQWIIDTVEMARVNQRYMAVLGMQPCLQGFMGALPTDFEDIANETLMSRGYDDISEYMVAQGDWSGFTRPPICKTTYNGYAEMASTFYETQEYIYGQATNYYAGDLAHEGGVLPEDLSKAEMSAYILDRMMEYDKNAVWVIQSWLSNPNREILEGFGEYREEHIIVLDLDSTENPHWDNTSNWNGKEFGGTSWVYCMLDNYGGRTGMHGELLTLATQITYANENSEHMKGIGITPEGTELNSVNYDLFWEMAWETETMDLDEWIKHYITRRYGAYSESIYKGWKLLIDTAYGSCNEDGTSKYHAGCVNCIINMRPQFEPEIVIGDYKLTYDPLVFEEAVALILTDFDKFKDVDCYIFDVVDLLRQLVANTEVEFFEIICEAYKAGEYDLFIKYKEKMLNSILLLDEISSYQEDGLVGHWIEKVENWYTDERNGEYDDFTKDMMEINAKAIISIWSSKTLQTYGHRQYSGMLADYNYPMWRCWLDAVDIAMTTGNYKAPTTSQDYFNFGWDFVINGKDYTTTVANPEGDETARSLLEIYEEIKEGYLTGSARKDVIVNDNVGGDGIAYAQTSLNGYVADRINDGATDALWIASSTDVPVYCGISFDGYIDVYALSLTAETRAVLGNNVMDYYIEAKDKDGSWVKIYEGDTYDEEAQSYTTDILLDQIVTTNDIRLTFTSNGGIYPALAEMKVYATSGILLIEGARISISDGVLKGTKPGDTVADLKDFMYHGQGELVFKDVAGNELTDDAEITVGTKVQLVYNSFVLDEAVINIIGLDVSELKEILGAAEAMNMGRYTEASIADLDAAEAAAEAVLDNEEATQEQVDKAAAAVAKAIGNLDYNDTVILNNIAGQGTTYAETCLGTDTHKRLNDGAANELWIAKSNSVPVYCGIMFEEAVTVEALQLIAETRASLGANVMDYYIQAKDENGKWVTVYTGDTYDEKVQSYTTNITLKEAVTTTDIRVTFTTNGGIYPALAEMSIYQVTDKADYTAVDEAIAKANALVKENYVDFSAVEVAIEAVVRDLEYSKQAEVDAMAKAIEDAIASLVKVVKKDALITAVAEAKGINTGLYTEESAAALADAIAEAEAVLVNADATQEEVDAAASALNNAVKALEEIKTNEVIRLAGDGRIDTALAVADILKETLGLEKFEAVIIARSKGVLNKKGKDTGFADALAGSYLAYVEKAPILLVSDARMDDVVDYVKANLKENGKVYILGGASAVSETLEEKLAGYDVDRLAGGDRYETNLMILDRAKVTGGELIVSTGKDFADSLSASAAKLPILMVKEQLNDAQKAFLESMDVKKIYIVGGDKAVNEDVAAELEAYAATERVAGENRRETSIKVAEKFFEVPKLALMASASDYPDGLCGGSLAAVLDAPLVLTVNGKTAEASAYTAELGIEAGYVLGGSSALGDEAVVDVFGLESAEEIIVR